MNRKEKSAETKAALFKAAVQLIGENGYDHVTVSQICEKAGVAKGTFYVHYSSKEDIIKESYYSDMGAFVLAEYEKLGADSEKKAKAEGPASVGVKERIRVFLTAELAFAEYAGFEMTCRAYIINLSDCMEKNGGHLQRRTFSAVLKDLIEEGIRTGEIRSGQSAEDLFLYLESMVRGLMASWCFSNGDFSIAQKGGLFLEQLIKDL